jgi:hypothetical protein
LLLAITTRACTCDWTAELDWVDATVAGRTLIDDYGHPFQTTADNPREAFDWLQESQTTWSVHPAP